MHSQTSFVFTFTLHHSQWHCSCLICVKYDFSLPSLHYYFYCPQIKFAKVMFIHVCLSTGGWHPSMPCRWYPSMPAGLQGVYPSMLCRYPDPHPGGSLRGLAGGVFRPTPRGEVQGSGQEGSPGPHRGGGSQHALRQTPTPDGYCCGWYASYWNAFLFCYVANSNNT